MQWLRRKLVNYLTRNLLRALTEEDVLRTSKKGGIMFKGKELTHDEVQLLARDAEALTKNYALRLILSDVEYLSNQTMFQKSNTFEDMKFGKAMLYNVDILRKKIANLASMKR